MARIFIIGDNLLIRTLLREILEAEGHKVTGQACHDTAAMSSVVDARPDVVIVDVVLLREAGLATLRQLVTIDRGLAVVVCAALLERKNAISALRIGAKGFILKPFNARSVLATVNDAVAHARPSAANLRDSTPAAQQPAGGVAEQRDFARLRAALPVAVEVEDGSVIETVTIDVSGGGVLLAGGSLPLGASVGFRLEIGAGEEPISGRARVVRITEDGCPALQFEQVHVAEHERLIAYLESAAHSGEDSAVMVSER